MQCNNIVSVLQEKLIALLVEMLFPMFMNRRLFARMLSVATCLVALFITQIEEPISLRVINGDHVQKTREKAKTMKPLKI